MRTILYLLSLTFVLRLHQVTLDQVWAPCPFNQKHCNCSHSYPRAYFTYQDAICESSVIPNFTQSTSRYVITGTLIITSDIQYIAVNHFANFSSINTLSLEHHSTDIPVQIWDASAFTGVKINHLLVSGLAGLLPSLPLQNLGQQGLRGLSISNGGISKLNDTDFTYFTSLEELAIIETQIDISDRLFDSLPNLKKLTLNGVGIKTFPTVPSPVMANLQELRLDDNLIHTIPDTLNNFHNLLLLSLSGNPLGNTILDIANGLPQLAYLYLDNAGLTSVPSKLLSSAYQSLQVLSLSNNQIQTITEKDFQYSSRISQLFLNGNPISSFENEAFSTLTSLKLFDFRDTAAASFDLATFLTASTARHHECTTLLLNDNPLLKSLTASRFNQIATCLRISVTNTALEHIDPIIGSVLSQHPKITIDLSQNGHLRCDELGWLKSSVLCTKQVKAEGAWCSDKNCSLTEYLDNLTPKTCPTANQRSVHDNLYAAAGSTTRAATTSTTRTPTTRTTPRSSSTSTRRPTSGSTSTRRYSSSTTRRYSTSGTTPRGGSSGAACAFAMITVVASLFRSFVI